MQTFKLFFEKIPNTLISTEQIQEQFINYDLLNFPGSYGRCI